MTKKVEKTTLYRLFFEICSVTTFSKNPPCSVTKTPVTPFNSSPDEYISDVWLTKSKSDGTGIGSSPGMETFLNL